MFGATILVPIVVNTTAGADILSIPVALVSSGLGTLIYLICTRNRSPAYLGSSFAFIAPMIAGYAIGGTGSVFTALMITYLGAAIISGLIFVFMVGPSNVGVEISKINWTSIILALAIVGLEVGYVFVYRAGWTVSTASVVANIGLACVLIVVGYWLYQENVSLKQIFGIVVCMVGLILINI